MSRVDERFLARRVRRQTWWVASCQTMDRTNICHDQHFSLSFRPLRGNVVSCLGEMKRMLPP